MALYPSLEDMNMDLMNKVQQNLTYSAQPVRSDLGAMYPALGDFMGLELTPETIAMNMPEYSQIVHSNNMQLQTTSQSGVVAPLSGDSLAMKKAFVTQGIRQVVLCKDGDGKVGMRFSVVSNGVFVCLVMKNSPAAMAGLRFGDQILEINNTSMAGLTMDQAHKVIKKAPVNGIVVAVRDRPFERTVTLHKDSTGALGFQFKDGKIISLTKDSSAARNGLLIDHQLVEVNGQNVVGMKDKEITKVIANADIVTLTILPYSIYKHMTNKIAGNLLKKEMDHTPI